MKISFPLESFNPGGKVLTFFNLWALRASGNMFPTEPPHRLHQMWVGIDPSSHPTTPCTTWITLQIKNVSVVE